ncbi:hypothetical protein [Rubrivirga sp. IMCC45206]|uniref:hypothetical protein n=1 Tax=Rubrivirga sp. IMCC45206 TaxID=3391614 RepID=UPI0039900B17
MSPRLYALVVAVLFACVSMYFGTGWSTVLFQFPVMPELTPDNYALHFLPQIDAATTVFTVLVTLMLAACAVMLWQEWRTRFRWVPIALLVLIVVSTGVTMLVVFPINAVLRAGVADLATLRPLVRGWMDWTWVRAALWSAEWAVLMVYLAAKAFPRPAPSPS